VGQSLYRDVPVVALKTSPAINSAVGVVRNLEKLNLVVPNISDSLDILELDNEFTLTKSDRNPIIKDLTEPLTPLNYPDYHEVH